MAVPKHLEEAARKLDLAMYRIDAAREQPLDADSQRQWLEGLTEFCFALSDIQEFNNESVHEKLHELAGTLGPERILLGKSRSDR
ncbi:MAG: hypothetical protein ACODAC_06945 [Pseudomonadota bacterium]